MRLNDVDFAMYIKYLFPILELYL